MINSVKDRFDDKTFIGVVEDISDPERLGRVKIRVEQFHGRKTDRSFIDTIDLPWATPDVDLAGGSFATPGEGKVVYLTFTEGDINRPNYSSSVHFNYNLQRKLTSLSMENYEQFYAISFDDKHQYYHDKTEGVMFDYVKSYMNIKPNGDVITALRDNDANMYIGSPDASEPAVLGNHWLNFMDNLISTLLGARGGPYLGNMGADVIAHPSLITVCNEYFANRPTYISEHLFLVDNKRVKPNTRKFDQQIGNDRFTTEKDVPKPSTTTAATTAAPAPVGHQPKERLPGAEVPADVRPSAYPEQLISSTVPDGATEQERARLVKPFGESYGNGGIPLAMLAQSKYIRNSFGNDERSYLLGAAATSLDEMLDAYNKQKSSYAPSIVISKGYHTFTRQENISKQYPVAAPAQGKDPFGWANQVELYWGAKLTDADALRSIIKGAKAINPLEMPLEWLVKNAATYGWRLVGRDAKGELQWWHWMHDPALDSNTTKTTQVGIAGVETGRTTISSTVGTTQTSQLTTIPYKGSADIGIQHL